MSDPIVTDAEIEAAGDAYHKQFISHPPKRSDYVGGFIVGALWAIDRTAAPDLLEACRAALIRLGGDDECIDMDPTINHLRAAIAKATQPQE